MASKTYLGLDIGASNIRVGLGNEKGIFPGAKRKVPTEDYWSEIGLAELITETLKKYGVSPENVDGIGIGVPGLVDSGKKEMILSNGLEELSFQKISDLDISYEIENDANAAAMGEKVYGDGSDVGSMATVIIGSGVGCGVYYGGELLGSKKDGRSPEPAGIVVDGETTWEQAVAGDYMPRYVTTLLEEDGKDENIPSNTDAEELFEISEEDEVIQDYIDRIAKFNSRGIAAIINLYAPELITFSGSVAVNNPEFMENSIQKAGELSINPTPEMKVSELGNDLGLYGALAVAQR